MTLRGDAQTVKPTPSELYPAQEWALYWRVHLANWRSSRGIRHPADYPWDRSVRLDLHLPPAIQRRATIPGDGRPVST
jgi:hypothetical protein